MQTISDIIEEFLLKSFEECDEIELSRNELAVSFNCVPSQINYVLSTRFTFERGYIVNSQRGGGGFIKIQRIAIDDDFISLIFEKIGNEVDCSTANGILKTLCLNDVLSEEQERCLRVALSEKSLKNSFGIENELRAKILKNTLAIIYKGKENK